MITTRSTAARLGLFVVGVGFWAAVDAGDAAPLSWKFRPGEVLRYESDQTTISRVKDPTSNQEASQTLTLTMDLTWTVKEVDPQGVANLTQTIDRIRTSMTIPNGKVAFDSKEPNDANSPAGPLFKLLVGAEFTFKMNPKGELADIKLSDKLLEAMKGDDPNAQSKFSEAGLKNMLTQLGVILPGGEVGAGQTWSRRLSIPSAPNGQNLEIEQTYTDKGADPAGKPLEVIEMATKFEPLKLDEKIPVTIKSQEATGRFLFDNAAGRVDSSRVTERVALAAQVQGKEIAQSNETVTLLTLRRDQNP